MTLATVSSPVRNLTATSFNETNITITWHQPSIAHGNITSYFIQIINLASKEKANTQNTTDGNVLYYTETKFGMDL